MKGFTVVTKGTEGSREQIDSFADWGFGGGGEAVLTKVECRLFFQQWHSYSSFWWSMENNVKKNMCEVLQRPIKESKSMYESIYIFSL